MTAYNVIFLTMFVTSAFCWTLAYIAKLMYKNRHPHPRITETETELMAFSFVKDLLDNEPEKLHKFLDDMIASCNRKMGISPTLLIPGLMLNKATKNGNIYKL